MAWLLATSPDGQLRDGPKAVQLAESACEAEPNDPIFKATLAAAYAETGRFNDAVKTAQDALGIAEAAGNNALVDLLRLQLSLYNSGQRYRDVR